MFHAFARSIVAVAAVVSLAGAPSAMAATGSTLVVSLKAFPGGTLIPNQIAGTFTGVQSGSVQTIAAPQTAYGPSGQAYSFVFWNITSDIRTTPTVSFAAPGDGATLDVTAWYFPIGGACGSSCPPPTGVSTYAFSMNNDQVLADTPIASVTPAGAWSGAPSTTVSTTSASGPVTITARSQISRSGVFHNWLQFGNGTIANTVLSVPYNGSSLAIGFFGIPVPDPCQNDRDELDALSPGDFLTLAAYQKAKAALTKQLVSCENQWGEL